MGNIEMHVGPRWLFIVEGVSYVELGRETSWQAVGGILEIDVEAKWVEEIQTGNEWKCQVHMAHDVQWMVHAVGM